MAHIKTINDNKVIIAVYLEVDPLNIDDPIRIFGFVGNPGTAGYIWSIKITMIDCKLNSQLQG